MANSINLLNPCKKQWKPVQTYWSDVFVQQVVFGPRENISKLLKPLPLVSSGFRCQKCVKGLQFCLVFASLILIFWGKLFDWPSVPSCPCCRLDNTDQQASVWKRCKKRRRLSRHRADAPHAFNIVWPVVCITNHSMGSFAWQWLSRHRADAPHALNIVWLVVCITAHSMVSFVWTFLPLRGCTFIHLQH